MSTIVNFAYGSNMLHRRIAARVPSARPLGPAVLHGHVLCWHKVGRDGSGKCDVVPADGDAQRVHGVLYEIAAAEMPLLHAAEGLGAGYDLAEMEVRTRAGERRTAQFYRATHVDPALRPFSWYRALVVAGAAEHGLPAPYVASLEAVEAVEDADVARAAAHLRLTVAG